MEFWIHTEIFPKDNASCHALKIVMEHLDKNDIFTLYWPPQSPDLNIIANIWDMITRKLHKNTKFIKSEQNEYYEKCFNFLSFNLFEIQSFQDIIRFT